MNALKFEGTECHNEGFHAGIVHAAEFLCTDDEGKIDNICINDFLGDLHEHRVKNDLA